MKLLPRSLSDILTPAPTPTPFPNKRTPDPPPQACHGAGCLSIPVPTTKCDGDACGVKAAAATPAPPETITIHLTDYVNNTIYQTSWMTAYDTIVSTVEHNNTITVTSTQTHNITNSVTKTMTAMHTLTLPPTEAAVVKQQHKSGLQGGDILSIILGVILLLMCGAMWFLARRFYRMYRGERVLRKQLQTEGVELKGVRGGNGAAGLGGGKAEMKEEWAI